MTPGPLEDLRQDEHGHVAADAVALPGDLQELRDHRLLSGRMTVVKLQCVRPAVEVRVPAMGEQQVAPRPLHARVVLWRSRQIRFCPGDVVLGVVLHPGVIQAGVVGDEVEHQPQAPCPEPLAQAGQRRISSEVGMHGVAGDREAGSGDVLLAQVRQRLLELSAPLAIGARHPLPGRPGAPHAQEPDPVEPHPGRAVQLGVRQVIQRGPAAQRPGQLRQPDARIDLIERGKKR